jgi:hypothetical protein
MMFMLGFSEYISHPEGCELYAVRNRISRYDDSPCECKVRSRRGMSNLGLQSLCRLGV